MTMMMMMVVKGDEEQRVRDLNAKGSDERGEREREGRATKSGTAGVPSSHGERQGTAACFALRQPAQRQAERGFSQGYF